MNEFRQLDEHVVKCETEQETKNRKFRVCCIQWDKTNDDGSEVEADLPTEVVVTLEDLQLPYSAATEEVEDAFALYLVHYYGFCHNGFFFEEMED